MDYLQAWGISAGTLNAIDDAARLCEDILSKAGYTPDAIDEWRCDVKTNTVIENDDITNSIIKGYFGETAKLLKEKGYNEVNYYADLGSSHFILNGSFHIDSCSLILGYKLPTAEQLKAYEKYKDKWIADHISDEVMKATTDVWASNPEYSDDFEEYLAEYGFLNGEIYADFNEFLDNEYENFLENAHYSLDSVINTIRGMGANEHITLDEFIDDVVLVITKDPDYDKNKNIITMGMDGKDVMNLVTVDFKQNGKSIASTYDIHVDVLESVLNDIRKGKTEYLIDEKRPLEKIVKDCKNKTSKAVEREC